MSFQTYFYSSGCGPGAYFNQNTYTNFSFAIGRTSYPISGQQVVAQGYGSYSCPNYTQPSTLPLTLPNTNNSAYPAGECVFTFSNGGGSSSCPSLVTNTIDPLYKVVSILYAPPGNESTQGLSSATTDGTTTSIGNSFTFGDEYTFSSGVTGVFNDSVSFGFALASSNTAAFAQTWTNAQSVATDDNYLDPAGANGGTGTSGSDGIEHNLDMFVVWLNPEITTTTYSDYSTPVSYKTGMVPVGNITTPDADIIVVPAANLMPLPNSMTPSNPFGTSTVPNSKILPSVHIGADGTQYSEPGLGVLCKNLNLSEYNSHCSLTDQCGCTPADFAQIVVQDPLLRYNASTLTPNPVLESDSPLVVDGSGVDTCGGTVTNNKVTVPQGSDCRFVIVPQASGSNAPLNIPLDGQSTNTASQTYTGSNILTSGSSFSYNVGLATQVGGIGAAMKNQQTWTWQDFQNTAVSQGASNSVQILLKTSTYDCFANIAVYEDTIYHTFAFQFPTGATGCN